MAWFWKKKKEIEEILGEELTLSDAEIGLIRNEDKIKEELNELENVDKAAEQKLLGLRQLAEEANHKGDEKLADKYMAEYGQLLLKAESNLQRETQKNALRSKLMRIRLAKLKTGFRKLTAEEKAARQTSA